MARDTRQLYVEIIGDDKRLSRAFKDATAESRKFDRNMSTSFRGVIAGSGAFRSLGRQIAFASGTFLGAAGLTSLIEGSVNAASDLEEQTNKVHEVFGQSARTITRWGTTTAAAIGIADDEALQAAGTFGNLFHTVGLTGEASAGMSKRLVQLAADLASFNNADPSDTLQALQSGLVGQARPLRQYGILLSEARVKQEAMRETGKRSASAITDQEKVIARYNLILKDSVAAQGDFARTADGQANAQRSLKAELRDTTAVLGKALLPMINDVTKKLRDWLADPQNQKKLQDDTEKTVGFLGKVGHQLAEVGGGFKDMYDAGNSVASVLDRINRKLNQHLRYIYEATPATHALTNEEVRLLGVMNQQRTVTGEDVGLRGAAARAGGVLPATVTGGGGNGRLSLQGQMNLLETRLAQALTTVGKTDDRALLVQQRHLLGRQLAATKDWQTRRQVYQDLARVQDQIAAIDKDRRDAEQAARDKELAAREKELAAEKARTEKRRAHIRALRDAWAKQLADLRDAAAQVRDQIGEVFQGPLLNPSDDVRKRTLGVPAISSGQLVADFRAQTKAFVAFNNDLARLSRRGAPSGLIGQLRGLGLGGAEQIHALATARGGVLRDLFRSFQQRERVVQQIAHADIHTRTVTIHMTGSRIGTTAATQRRGRQAGVPSSIGSYIGG